MPQSQFTSDIIALYNVRTHHKKARKLYRYLTFTRRSVHCPEQTQSLTTE